MSPVTLYGAPLSLYTGRARSYLIKAGIAYREVAPITTEFVEQIVPKAGGRRSMPTLELADGSVIRDGVAIVDHFEDQTGHSFSPTTVRQAILSRLFDVIGAEGLLRPAMHYRWNFPEQNQALLKFHFESATPRLPNRAEIAEKSANRMRAACMSFGAVPETFAVVEALYQQLLEKLDSHFAEQPYLFGGKPAVGDFGMIAPLYGHLGRDPKPLSMMQLQAVRLFRWVERMNRPELDVGEFEIQDGAYLGDDQVPTTLVALLQQLAVDFVPETRAACACINEWLAQQDTLAAGTQVARGVGMASFELEGVTVNALAQPFRFYLLKRVQDLYESLDAQEQQSVRALLGSCNMAELLELKLDRDIGRQNNLEVWL